MATASEIILLPPPSCYGKTKMGDVSWLLDLNSVLCSMSHLPRPMFFLTEGFLHVPLLEGSVLVSFRDIMRHPPKCSQSRPSQGQSVPMKQVGSAQVATTQPHYQCHLSLVSCARLQGDFLVTWQGGYRSTHTPCVPGPMLS